MGKFLGILNLNSRKVKKSSGNLDTNQMTKGGIKRNQISEKYRVIFDALNKMNANGQVDDILDKAELDDFWNKLTECANDDTLGGREAGKFLKGLDLKGLKKEDLYAFINEINNLSANIDFTETTVDEDGNEIFSINYLPAAEGTKVQERINKANGTSELENTAANGTVTTQYKNADKAVEKQTVEKEDYFEETSYVTYSPVFDENNNPILDEEGNPQLEKSAVTLDSKGNPVPVETTITTNNNTRKIVIAYQDGEESIETITDDAEKTEEVWFYDGYDSAGEPIRLLSSIVENKGLEEQSTTSFKYNNDGIPVSSETSYKNSDKTVIRHYAPDGETVVFEDTKEGSKVTRMRYGEDGSIRKTVWSDVVGEVVDENDGSVTYQVTKDNRTEQTLFNVNGLFGQIVTKNGKEYIIKYDGEGNTMGIVVQFGETPEQIAKKFGCEEKLDELIAINGGREAFSTGALIKVPGEIEADAKVLQGRGSSAQEIKKQQQYNARVARQRAMKEDENSRVLIENYEIRDVGDDKLWACNSAKDIAMVLFEKEGRTEISQTELDRRIQQIKDDNPGKFGDSPEGVKTFRGKVGQRGIAGCKLNLRVAPSSAEQYGAQTTRINDIDIPLQESRGREKGTSLAYDLKRCLHVKPGDYDYKKYSGSKIVDVAKSINSSNVEGLVSSYKNIFSDLHKKGGNTEKAFLNRIKNSLVKRAQQLGLPESEIKKLDVITSGNDSQAISRQVNGVVDLMRTLQNTKPSQRAEKIKELLKTDGPVEDETLAKISKQNASQASDILQKQLDNEGWAEWLFDRTMNWSDSSSSATRQKIENFKNAYNEVRQASMVDGKIDQAKFVELYKNKFGVDYDPVLMNRFHDTQDKLNYGLAYEDYFKNFVSEDPNRMSAEDLKAKMLAYPGFQDAAKQKQISSLSSKEDLCNFLDSYSLALQKHCGTKDTVSLAGELSDISRKVFGPNYDVIGDAQHFVNRQKKGGGYVKLGTTIVVTMATAGLGGGATAVTLTAGAIPLASETGDGLMKAYAQSGPKYALDDDGNVIVDETTGEPVILENKSFGEAFAENTNYLDAAGESLLNMMMVKGGGAFVKEFRAGMFSGNVTKSQALVCDLISSEILSVGTEGLMTGDISWEGVAMGALPLLGARGRKGGNKGGVTETASGTPEPAGRNMSEALNTAAKGSPYSSSVRVGKTKAGKINAQIEQAVQEGNYTTEDLLNARKDSHIIENRDLQKQVNARLDEVAKSTLSPSEYADYQAGRKSQIMEWAENALSGDGVLSPSGAKDIRAGLDYMTPEQLRAAKAQLEPRRNCYVQGKDHAADVIKEIDAKLRTVNAQGATVETVTDALANRASKRQGLSAQERSDLETLISKTNDANTLNSLRDSWQKVRKFAGSGDKKRIDNLFASQADKIASQPARPTFSPAENTPAARGKGSIDFQFDLTDAPRLPLEAPSVDRGVSIFGSNTSSVGEAFVRTTNNTTAPKPVEAPRAVEAPKPVEATKPVNTTQSSVNVSVNRTPAQEVGRTEVLSKIETLQGLNNDIFARNVQRIRSGVGELEKIPQIREGAIIEMYENGVLAEADLVEIFSKGSGLISRKDFNYFASKKIKLTPYDTPEIIDARHYNATNPSLEVGSPYYNQVRQSILAEEMPKIAQAASDGKMVIVTGLPGGGKSTVVKTVLGENFKNTYYSPDADAFKAEFKDYFADGVGAGLVHKPSTTVLKQDILPEVFRQKKNIVYQTTGGEETLNKIIEQARAAGYSVEIIHANIEPDMSMQRALGRFTDPTDGRFLDPYVTLGIYNEGRFLPNDIPTVMSNDSRITSITVYDTNGKSPVFVSKSVVK